MSLFGGKATRTSGVVPVLSDEVLSFAGRESGRDVVVRRFGPTDTLSVRELPQAASRQEQDQHAHGCDRDQWGRGVRSPIKIHETEAGQAYARWNR